MSDSNWDFEVDFLAVGSGPAGLTAALTAAKSGLNTLVIEKAAVYGGNAALSAGVIWVPNNQTLIRQGVRDSRADARAYLDAIVGDEVPSANIDAFLDAGPQMITFLESTSPHLRFQWCKNYPDYHPEEPGGRPGGRSIEPDPLDLNTLGADRKRLRRSQLPIPPGVFVTAADYAKINMMLRTRLGRRTALAVGLRAVAAALQGRRTKALGEALIGRLRLALKDAGVPLWLNTPMTSLITDESGAVTGVLAQRDGSPVRIRARRAVLVATGGFEFNTEMRDRYLPEGAKANFSTGAPDSLGEGIEAGEKIGAALANMDGAWWISTIRTPEDQVILLVAERALPGSIIVDQAGRRFANEAAPYETFVRNQLAGGHDPIWYIFDSRVKRRYPLFGLIPVQPFPRSWFKSGLVSSAPTLAELADKIGVPKDALTGTVQRFNTMADARHDEDFGRGESAYDTYYGDDSLPNATLAAIDDPPYYAVRLRAGDIGTKGGLVYNANAQVLRPDGTVIEGLYTAGNASAAVMGNDYAGAGATIGPAMTFGFIAARHAAR